MIIQHNLSSLNTSNKLKINIKKSASSIEKLSSGLRINRAADDAAGLAISEKMRAQIRGLSQAQRNVQDGISLIQTAEGGLAEMHAHLQRMRELSIQAANGTLQDNDRQMVQYEIDQLKQGIDSIANNTEFNGIELLNRTTILPKVNASYDSNGHPIVQIFSPIGKDASETVDNIIESVNLVKTGKVGNTISKSLASEFIMHKENDYDLVFNSISGFGYSSGANNFVNPLQAANISLIFPYSGGGSCYRFYDAVTIDEGIGISGPNIHQYLLSIRLYSSTTNNNLTLQVGANAGQTLQMSISDMRTTALGINNVNVTTQMSAEQAISLIDTAISKASSERSKMGAYQNKLEHIGKNLSNYEENITASESRIRDVDMATEIKNFTMSNILIQAAEAMLAQANQEPQSILQLLK